LIRKAVIGILLTLLLVGIVTFGLNIQPVKASGTIYIRADGSIDPPTAPISTVDNVTYTLTGNITSDADGIVVERDNIIVDGNGYTLQGTGAWGYRGIYLGGRSGVTIKDTKIAGFRNGIWLYKSSSNSISGNNITTNGGGIFDLHAFSGDASVGVILVESSSNMISKNNIENSTYGISISSPDNIVIKNNITNNGAGIEIGGGWGGNTISRNNILNNVAGIRLRSSDDNVFYDNNIINNEYGVYEFFTSSNNVFHHNNFIDNTYQVDYDMEGVNVWDNGYPSGGNYWSDFDGRYPDVEDVYSGPYQNETGSDGIWDHFYWITSGNRDNYPLVTSYAPSRHELIVFELAAPASITLGGSSLLNATLTNQGSTDETNVEFMLLINGTIVDSIIIPLLQVGNSHMLSYLWTPTVKGTYNVTAYAHPLPGETSVENNQKTKFTTVWAVGVKAGNWIKYEYTYTNAPSETPLPTWIKVEFLSVEGTTVTLRLTMSMSNGTESSETLTLDVARTLAYGTGGTFDTLFGFGFVIPANSTVGGDYIYIMLLSPAFMLGKQIDGETTGTYAGASRIVVYATFSYIGARYGNRPLKYYWDKQTGVMVEASATLDGMTVTAKATETNMWETATTGEGEEVPFWMQWWLWAIVAVAVVAVAGTFCFFKRRKPPTPTAPSLPTEAT
jgi:parallel beta-helix repeat protein